MYPEYKYSKKLLPLPQCFTNKSDDSKVFRADLHKKATCWVTQGPVLRGFMVQNPAVATLKFLIIFEHKVLLFLFCTRYYKLCSWTYQLPTNINPYLTYLEELLWMLNRGHVIKFFIVYKAFSHKSYSSSVNGFVII